MQRFAETCERIAATTKKLEKTAIVAEYLRSLAVDDAAIAAVFLSGRAFPAFEERTLQIGGASLWKLVQELTGATEAELSAGYRRTGDLGAAVCRVMMERDPRHGRKRAEPRAPSSLNDPTLAQKKGEPFDRLRADSGTPEAPASAENPTLGQRKAEPGAPRPDRASERTLAEEMGERGAPTPPITLLELSEGFEHIAEVRTANAKADLLKALLARATPLETKYILKIITGELRIGLKESLVEEAIAKAWDEPLDRVQRANMLLGDIGATLRLAAEHRLGDARMRLFHPIGFMLATPAADAREAFEYFDHAQVEDKYDGIRAQAHCGGGQVRLFSRTLDEVTQSFPELAGPLTGLGDAILDGEIVAWRVPQSSTSDNVGHAMPFSDIQKRLGRKQVSGKLIEQVPVAYLVFDVLYAQGELMLEKPLTDRMRVLDRLFGASGRIVPRGLAPAQGQFMFGAEQEAPASGWILRAPSMRADSPEQLAQFFEEAMARGNEGLMIKDVQSSYLPGRRGRWWLKLKRELATLDVVVTRAEFGNGKRAQVLSDYTFAVRKGEELVNIGKAYSGLTDAEIAELTQWFFGHTVQDYGHVRDVEPKIVLEVAFNAIMRSDRHDSGYALRFPRIVRIRPDKLPAEIDTVETVEKIFRRQHGRDERDA